MRKNKNTISACLTYYSAYVMQNIIMIFLPVSTIMWMLEDAIAFINENIHNSVPLTTSEPYNTKIYSSVYT